jgi:hypothetical protein
MKLNSRLTDEKSKKKRVEKPQETPKKTVGKWLVYERYKIQVGKMPAKGR